MAMGRFLGISIFLLMVLAALAVPASAEPDRVHGDATVIDGDTIRFDHISEAIELWGMDAPEIWTPEGIQSKLAMQHIVWAGQPLTCIKASTMVNGRPLARCTDRYGRDIAKRMIVQGYARAFRTTLAEVGVPFSDAWQEYSRMDGSTD